LLEQLQAWLPELRRRHAEWEKNKEGKKKGGENKEDPSDFDGP
jgi:hypothetical protein